MDKLLQQLVDKLQKAFAGDLVSVILYGSAATGEHHAKFSDYNVLCVLKVIAAHELAAAEDIFRWWREQGSPAPMLLTEHELTTSTDCFAIEFHDLKKHHRVLSGTDVLEGLAVDDSFYRAQVEHELRAKMLRLRQKASGIMSDSDLLRRLLLDSFSTFCVLFRHALLLHGIDAPSRKREIIQQCAEHFGLETRPFESMMDVREEKVKPRDLEPVSLLEAYLAGIGKVTDAVDRLEK
jgi:hypothetical protein